MVGKAQRCPKYEMAAARAAMARGGGLFLFILGADMPIRLAVLASCVLIFCASAFAATDNADQATMEARMKALEQRMSDLEAKLDAKSAPTASGAPAVTVVPHVAQPGAVTSPVVWRDSSKWAQIKRGQNWSQVREILGTAGKTMVGVFGEVWYYPDDSGGRIVFDRDGRVSEFNPPPAR
jgi:hypothetical protein